MNQSNDVIELAVTDGLAPGAKLRENRLFRLNRHGVEFAGQMNYEQWQHGLALLRMGSTSLQMWLADFLKYGRALYGDERVQDALVQLEFPEVQVSQALGIASLPAMVRKSELSVEHYWVLAKTGLTPKDQETWAASAVEHRLSASALARSIETGKIIKPESGSGRSRSWGMPTPQGIRQIFDAWYHQVASNDPLTKWDDERLRELWEELKGPVQVGLQVARRLGIAPESEVTG